MEIFGFDILSVFTPINILVILFGSFVGTLVGALPGLGTLFAIVIILPLTYSLPPLAAILMLLSAYQGAEYGGSISAITLAIPGTPAAAATILDGNVMARKGMPGKALRFSLTSSTIGGLCGAFMLMFLTKPLGDFCLRFSAPDYFLVSLIGIFAVVTLNSKDMVKGLIMVILGLVLGTVGNDSITGTARFIFGHHELMDGINTVALVVGVFAIPEVFIMVSESLNVRYITDVKKLKAKITMKEHFSVAKPTILGSIIGMVVGILPGLGAAPSAWFSYMLAKKTSKHPEEFGNGSAEGIVAPEAANNACVAGALLPMLALGIPGSAAIAVISSAFLIHGIQIGPTLFSTNTDLVYGLFVGFFITILAMYIIGRVLTQGFARLLAIPNYVLAPCIMLFALIGVYAEKTLFFNLWFALGMGVVAYFLKRLDFPLPTMVLAFILSDIIESNFRRALSLSNGSFSIFYESTYSKVILSVLILIIFFPLLKKIAGKIKERTKGEGSKST